MPDLFLYAGEANPNDIKLSDPTVVRSSGGIIEAEGLSAGTSIVLGQSAIKFVSVGSSTGVAVITGFSATILASVGASQGIATVTGISATILASVGTSTGTSIVSGVSAKIVAAVGAITGSSTVLGESETLYASAGGGSYTPETSTDAGGVDRGTTVMPESYFVAKIAKPVPESVSESVLESVPESVLEQAKTLTEKSVSGNKIPSVEEIYNRLATEVVLHQIQGQFNEKKQLDETKTKQYQELLSRRKEEEENLLLLAASMLLD